MRLRIDLGYDGLRFFGFARQRDRRTVQGVLEDALSRISGSDVQITGAGRTDRGVHATGQVVHADVPSDARCATDLERMRGALDKMVGDDITVWKVRSVPDSFDARFSATLRRYRYRLCDAPAIDPLERHRTWHVGPPRLDVDAMNAAAAHLLGEHDFSSFCRRVKASGNQPDAREPHLVRRIDLARVRRERADLVVVAVEGPAFCHQMVRSITGCLADVGAGRRNPEWVGEVLRAQDRAAAGRVAPPHGLTLIGVRYR